jgi:xylan 1,4-beta-xylosidase
LIGDPVGVYAGSDLRMTEAPHVFKRNGWYDLTTAKGGTGYDHAVTMARSRSILGPYGMHPRKHLMSARFTPDWPLQRVGHGECGNTGWPGVSIRFVRAALAGAVLHAGA